MLNQYIITIFAMNINNYNMKNLTSEQNDRRLELIKLYVSDQIKRIKGQYVSCYVQTELIAEYMLLMGQDIRDDEMYHLEWENQDNLIVN